MKTAYLEEIRIRIWGTRPGREGILPVANSLNDETHALSFAFAIPLEKQSAHAAIVSLERLISFFNRPHSIRSDIGAEYMGNDFIEVLLSRNTQHIRSSDYPPQTNGKTELSHKGIKGRALAAAAALKSGKAATDYVLVR